MSRPTRLAAAGALSLLLAGPAAAEAIDDCQDPARPAAERVERCTAAVDLAVIDFRRAPALLGRARALRESGELDAAMVDALAAESASPTWAEPVFEQARIRAAQGRGDEAVAQARRATALAPGDLHVLLAGMEIMAEAGRPEACLEAAPEAERLAPQDPFVFAVRGRCLNDVGDHAAAAEALRRAIAHGQDTGFNRSNLAFALLRRGQPVEAAAEARRALALDPSLGVALGQLVAALMDMGEAEAALSAWRKAFPAVASDRAWAANEFAWDLYLAGRHAEGLAILEEGALSGESPPTSNQVDTQAHLLAALGRPEEAVAAFREAAALDPAVVALYDRRLRELGHGPFAEPGSLLACARTGATCLLYD